MEINGEEVGICLEKDHFSESNNRRNDRSISYSKSRSGSRSSTNRDRIRCYKCREYDHITKDCPKTKERKANRANTTVI